MRRNIAQIKSSEKHEVIVYFHDHWIILIGPIIHYIVGLAIFFLFVFLASSLRQDAYLAVETLLLLSVLVLFFIHHRLFIALIDWELSSWVITTELVIDFENSLYTKNDVIYVNIHKIHEIEKKKHGFLSNFFDYGEIYINVAAAPYPIICRNIPHPDDFINLIEAIRANHLTEELDIKVLKGIYGRKYRYMLSHPKKP
jgi:hypothetical protein